jgi:hypothetical protein
MKSFDNKKRVDFLGALSRPSFDSDNDSITKKCKFNFSYFQKQPAGQDFDEWSKDQLSSLMIKLVELSEESLEYWMQQRAGGGRVLDIYQTFPKPSQFSPPKHIPHQAWWGRFRLNKKSRLVGFVIPNSYSNSFHQKTGLQFDCNTFYVVFLDANHKFAP